MRQWVKTGKIWSQTVPNFWSTSPKFDDFLPQISPILPTGASNNDKNHFKYGFTSSKQNYLPITDHFGGLKRVSDKLLSDFWSTSSKFDDFLPQISPILPTGTSHNDKNHSKWVSTSWKQTYLPITNHFGGHRRVSGKLLSDFWSTSPKFDDFLPQISSILPNGAS